MDFNRIIKSLSLPQMVSIIGKAILRPFAFYCFVKATKKCIAMSDAHFGNTHHKNNKANAYRHALWNMLIAHQVLRIGKNLSSALAWAKEITDWHESAFVNNPLERQMDLHNNKLGRLWFEEMYGIHKQVYIGEIDCRILREIAAAEKLTEQNRKMLQSTKNLIYIDES